MLAARLVSPSLALFHLVFIHASTIVKNHTKKNQWLLASNRKCIIKTRTGAHHGKTSQNGGQQPWNQQWETYLKLIRWKVAFAGCAALSRSWSTVCCRGLRMSDEIRATEKKLGFGLSMWKTEFIFPRYKTRPPALMNSRWEALGWRRCILCNCDWSSNAGTINTTQAVWVEITLSGGYVLVWQV